MVLPILIALLALWALAALFATSLCVVAGRADRDELTAARGAMPLRPVGNR